MRGLAQREGDSGRERRVGDLRERLRRGYRVQALERSARATTNAASCLTRRRWRISATSVEAPCREPRRTILRRPTTDRSEAGAPAARVAGGKFREIGRASENAKEQRPRPRVVSKKRRQRPGRIAIKDAIQKFPRRVRVRRLNEYLRAGEEAGFGS